MKLTWTSDSRTDPGQVREANEDACLDRPDIGLWAVADGMGGYTAGDVASGMIVEALGDISPRGGLSHTVEQIEARLARVNTELRQFARQRQASTIGSTVAALTARDEFAVCLWAGDSRVYRHRDGVLDQVSQDHAVVEELVDKGVLSPKQALHHPHTNLLTRAIGATDALVLDLEIVELAPGDVFVMCSDGLDKEVSPTEIANTIQAGWEQSLSHSLVELALSRGSRDNVTVVAVHIRGTAPA